MRNHAFSPVTLLDSGSDDPPRDGNSPATGSGEGRGSQQQEFPQRSKTTIRLLRAVAQGEEDFRHKRFARQEEVWDRMEKKLQMTGE